MGDVGGNVAYLHKVTGKRTFGQTRLSHTGGTTNRKYEPIR